MSVPSHKPINQTCGLLLKEIFLVLIAFFDRSLLVK